LRAAAGGVDQTYLSVAAEGSEPPAHAFLVGEGGVKLRHAFDPPIRDA
jgi:hypothetical protein